jgi:hypothetical protein
VELDLIFGTGFRTRTRFSVFFKEAELGSQLFQNQNQNRIFEKKD